MPAGKAQSEFSRRMGAGALLCLLAAPAMAGTLTPPKGCTAFLTVQLKSCIVEHHWTCAGDPEGHRWQLTIDENGPRYLSRVDGEYRWIEAWPQGTDIHRALVEPEADPASLTGLLKTGYDSYEFEVSRQINGTPFPAERVKGFDRLTGETVEIDGETLLLTEFEFDAVDGDGRNAVHVRGQQFVSERFRLFFSGLEVETTSDGQFTYDERPVKFLEPGEPGFLSDTPVYDCGLTMSGLALPPSANKEM